MTLTTNRVESALQSLARGGGIDTTSEFFDDAMKTFFYFEFDVNNKSKKIGDN